MSAVSASPMFSSPTEISSPKPTKKRSRFTPEEDQKLTNLVSIYGENNWALVTTHFPNRNIRQVRERWVTYLSPNLRSDPFTPEEDALLEEKLNELGPKWVTILKFFPSRTDTALKNRWKMIKRHRENISSKKQNRKKTSPHSSGAAPTVPYKITPTIPVMKPIVSVQPTIALKHIDTTINPEMAMVWEQESDEIALDTALFEDGLWFM